MNALDRFQRQLAGRSIDRPLNFSIFMAFAAHLIERPLADYYLDHNVLCEANYAVVNQFGVDLVQAISDPYREAHDFGAQIDFPPDGLPICTAPRLQHERDLATLEKPLVHVGPRMSDRLRAIERFRKDVGGELPIMGWVEGALAEAADLRGVQTLLMDLVYRPAWVHELLEICCEVAIDFALAQIEAGADIIGLGDAIASQVSPAMYSEFAAPYERRVFDAVYAAGAIPRLHICGDITHLLPQIEAVGPSILDLDWMVDIKDALDALPEDVLVCGNVDPVSVMLKATPEEVSSATLQCLEAGGSRLIAGAGCEIPDGTPFENLHAQRKSLATFLGH